MKIARDRDARSGWTSVPHGLWAVDLRNGPKLLLIWLHSHSDSFLANLSMNQCRKAMGASSVVAWFDALEEAGFVKVTRSEKTGRAAKIVLCVDAWEALYRAVYGAPTAPYTARKEEQGEEHGSSSLRSEEDLQSELSTRTQVSPQAKAVKAAQDYWDWHIADRGTPPVSPFHAIRSVCTALAKKGYEGDEMVDGLKRTRVMSAKAVQDEIETQRRRAEGATGRVIPNGVVRAFADSKQWLLDHGVVQQQVPALMELVASFVAREFGVGETMLRLAVALRSQPDSAAALNSFRALIYRAKVDRFPGELADYPDAMERAFRNQYWRAS